MICSRLCSPQASGMPPKPSTHPGLCTPSSCFSSGRHSPRLSQRWLTDTQGQQRHSCPISSAVHLLSLLQTMLWPKPCPCHFWEDMSSASEILRSTRLLALMEASIWSSAGGPPSQPQGHGQTTQPVRRASRLIRANPLLKGTCMSQMQATNYRITDLSKNL